MVKTIIDIPQFIFNLSPFLMALIFWTITTILLSKSIKKNAKVYYWIFGVLSFWGFISFFSQVFKFGLPKITSYPILDQLFVEIGYAQYFIHPILVIIMVMGAFSPKIKPVGRLMTIRKELSIIVGFPVLSHAIKRIILMVPSSWNFFANYEESIASPRVVSALGSSITHGVYLLGIFMSILFLVLWVTSFDSVHRKLGSKRWKSVQRWSYGLYAMLFIHAVGIDLGGLVNLNARERLAANTSVIEQVVAAPHSPKMSGSSEGHSGATAPAQPKAQSQAAASSAPSRDAVRASTGRHAHTERFSLAKVEIGQRAKYIINIIILIIIYGSYLYFRLRKAKLSRQRKSKQINK